MQPPPTFLPPSKSRGDASPGSVEKDTALRVRSGLLVTQADVIEWKYRSWLARAALL